MQSCRKHADIGTCTQKTMVASNKSTTSRTTYMISHWAHCVKVPNRSGCSRIPKTTRIKQWLDMSSSVPQYTQEHAHTGSRAQSIKDNKNKNNWIRRKQTSFISGPSSSWSVVMWVNKAKFFVNPQSSPSGVSHGQSIPHCHKNSSQGANRNSSEVSDLHVYCCFFTK